MTIIFKDTIFLRIVKTKKSSSLKVWTVSLCGEYWLWLCTTGGRGQPDQLLHLQRDGHQQLPVLPRHPGHRLPRVGGLPGDVPQQRDGGPAGRQPGRALSARPPRQSEESRGQGKIEMLQLQFLCFLYQHFTAIFQPTELSLSLSIFSQKFADGRGKHVNRTLSRVEPHCWPLSWVMAQPSA